MADLAFVRLHSIPPSTNKIWTVRQDANGIYRIFKTSVYKSWKAQASKALAASIRPVGGKVRLWINVHGGQGWIRSRDISNVIKPIEDALVEGGVIPDDDCRVVTGHVCRYFEAPGDKYQAFIEVAVEGK